MEFTIKNNDKQPKGNYQPAGSYAAANHNHNGVYQPIGSYAASNHNHDSVYAKSNYWKTHDSVTGITPFVQDKWFVFQIDFYSGNHMKLMFSWDRKIAGHVGFYMYLLDSNYNVIHDWYITSDGN